MILWKKCFFVSSNRQLRVKWLLIIPYFTLCSCSLESMLFSACFLGEAVLNVLQLIYDTLKSGSAGTSGFEDCLRFFPAELFSGR